MHRGWLVAALLVAAQLGALYAAQQWQATGYDEPELLYSGLRALNAGDFSASPHPPLTKLLSALPVWLLANPPMPPDAHDRLPAAERPRVRTAWDEAKTLLFATPGVNATQTLRLARLGTLLLWAITALAVYGWSSELYGGRAGLLSLGLLATCPVMLASTQIITTDIGGVAFGTLGLYLTTRALLRPAPLRFAVAGAAFGLALASRYQPLALTACAVGVVGLIALADRWRPPIDDRDERPTLSLGAATLGGAALLLAALAALIAVYGGPDRARHFPEAIAFLKGSIGPKRHFVYFLDGEVSKDGWLTYFPRALLYKLTPGHALAIGATLVGFALGRRLRRAEWLVVIPTLALFGLAVLSRINYGVRHVLPVLPPLYVLAGGLAPSTTDDSARTRLAWAALIALPLIGAVEQARHHPHYIPYLSPAFGGTARNYHRLADSGVDMGQGLIALRETLGERRHDGVLLAYYGTGDPGHYGIPYRYLSGQHDIERLAAEPRGVPATPRYLAVSIQFVQRLGLYGTPGSLWWLRDEPPDLHPGGSILVWDIADRPAWYGRLAIVQLERAESGYLEPDQQAELRRRATRWMRLMRQRAPEALDTTLAELDRRAAQLGPGAGPGLVFHVARTLPAAGFPRETACALYRALQAGRYGPLPPDDPLAPLVAAQLRRLCR